MALTNKLTAIANAIRAKTGKSDTMTMTQMVTEIENLSGGTLISKTITENGVYNASSDNADGYDVVTVDVPERNTIDELFADTLEIANIPSATKIIANLFESCVNLTNVIMPNVVSIGTGAFAGCTNLALTSLPSGVTGISVGTFSGCTSLALTSLPSGVKSIGSNAFNGCTSLALTSLPSGVKSIGNTAFRYCNSIPYLDFSEFSNIPTIGSTVFGNTAFPFLFRDQQQLDEWAAETNWSSLADRFQIKPSEG